MPTYALCESCPLFVIMLWCLLEHGSHTLFPYVDASTKYGLHRAMPIDRLLLQAQGALSL